MKTVSFSTSIVVVNGNSLQFLSGKFHGQRSLEDYLVLGVAESDMTEQLAHTHTTSIIPQG